MCTPVLFLQMYTIHALVGNDESTRRLLPIYAFLPPKTEICYEIFFREVKKCFETFEVLLSPLYVLPDFENAAINASKSVFHQVSINIVFISL